MRGRVAAVVAGLVVHGVARRRLGSTLRETTVDLAWRGGEATVGAVRFRD